jgi:hypothetical protein
MNMSDKTNFTTSVPTYWSRDNKALINWIEDGISNKHIKYYDYNGFSNLKVIGSRSFGKVYRAHWKNFRTTLALKTFYGASMYADDVEEIVYEVITLQYMFPSL